jgi:hypothetical protein
MTQMMAGAMNGKRSRHGEAGTRPFGPNGRVNEADSLGEASKSCGGPAGF